MSDDTWEQTRQKGKWHFVFWNGVVLWGLPMALLQLFVFVEPPSPSSWFYSATSRYPVSWVLFLLALGGLFGLIYGLFVWSKHEREHEKD